jgi:hypothetical protein
VLRSFQFALIPNPLKRMGIPDRIVKKGSKEMRLYFNPLEIEQVSYKLKELNPDTSISCLK